MICISINKLCAFITLIILILPSCSIVTMSTTVNDNAMLQNENQEGNLYDLLIISPKIFHDELFPLVNHKNRFGVRTILVDTDVIYDQMFRHGRDDAEKVKYFIKAAVENWGVHYVLLVGGRSNQGHIEKWWIPVRYSYLNRPYETFLEAKVSIRSLFCRHLQ